MTQQNSLAVRDNTYRLLIVTDDESWDSLVDDSLQGNVFSSSLFLRALDVQFSRFEVRATSGESLAVAAVIERDGLMHHAPFAFTPHQGILFSSKINSLPSHKQVPKKLELTEFLIRELVDRYGNFHMSLSPYFDDLRPFTWHNFHAPSSPRFTIIPRYTALLDLKNFDHEKYLSSIRAVRRQEFNKSPAIVSQTQDVDAFIEIYKKNFERQDIHVDDPTLIRIRQIVLASIGGGFGHLSVAKVEGYPASMSLFLHDKKCAWYLFGANDPGWRKSGASTRLMIENIRHYAKLGIPAMDFVGVNSPQRGDYKLSFNGQLTPYFEVHLEGRR